jgi:hypothetical protein
MLHVCMLAKADAGTAAVLVNEFDANYFIAVSSWPAIRRRSNWVRFIKSRYRRSGLFLSSSVSKVNLPPDSK